jgi:FKBP-type peptidyl-prolyl cis-trans isomerase
VKIPRKYIIIISILILISGVLVLYFAYYQNKGYVELNKNSRPESTKQNLKEVNKFLVQKDKERIKTFLERRDWNMKNTKSGLWYSIYNKGTGKKVTYGDYVKLEYEIRLLDGTLLYASDSDGSKIVHVGRGDEVQGLHEGLQFLHKGDEARFIIPPHLAHGLIGDHKRIPARAILYYEVKVTKVSDQKIHP